MQAPIILLLAAVLWAAPLVARAQENQSSCGQSQGQTGQQEEGSSAPKNQKPEIKAVKKSGCQFSGIPGKWGRDHQVGPDSPTRGTTVPQP